jgi:protein-serine/threonine kinase
MLKHPNIVRLYDVIETDKYIGIILDYASGGELFDHILAHRFLKEKDACRLFAQLISGVWYIHQRKIVHRDLKLENLLLDRNRNVIITDFGFANRFEHRTDDLMQTSCGSPCYAAPELVISEGAYVGSAVDIWSCGVILYAMLAGYLPFDDDPANPDGDNINLLYKYIVNTPLSFPDYISREARDLLSIMLQPDPQRRADLNIVMQHPWLSPYAYLFDKSVDDLETSAIELHKAKRQAYQRQMRNAAQASTDHPKVARSQSAKNDAFPHASVAVAPRSQSHAPEDQTLYETSADLASASQVQAQTRRGYSSTIVMPTQPSGYVNDDPFAQSPVDIPPVPVPIASTTAEQQQPQRTRPSPRKDQLPPVPAPTTAVNGVGSVRNKAASGMRHTIQVEYGQPEPPPVPQPKRDETPKKEPKPSQDLQSTPPLPQPPQPQAQSPSTPPQQQREKPRRPSVTGPRPLPPSPPIVIPPAHAHAPTKIEPPLVTVNAASPPTTPHPQTEEKGPYVVAGITGSSSSKKGKHGRGLSIDKMGLGKIFGATSSAEAVHSPPQAARVPSESSAANSVYTTISKFSGSSSRRPSTLQVASSSPSSSPTVEASATQTSLLSPDNGKKSRRSTLSSMVEPLARSIKVRPGRSSTREPQTPSREKGSSRAPSDRQLHSAHPTSTSDKEAVLGERVPRAPDTVGHGMHASTSKARKVMQWFRSRSKGRGLGDDGETPVRPGGKPSVRDAFAVGTNDSSTSVNAMHVFPSGISLEEYTNVPSRMGPPHPQRTISTGAEDAQVPSFAELVRRHVASPKGAIRTHHGAVSQATVTTGIPSEVMRHVRAVLEGMGVNVQVESDYKYRCVRAKRRRAPTAPSGFGLGLREPGASTGLGLAAFTLIGSAASNGVCNCLVISLG